MGQLLDKWLEATEPHQRPRTVYENKRKIEARIRPKLGSIRLSKLGADTLDAAYRQWLDEGLSAACRQAAKWGWIDAVPTARATPTSVTRKEMVVPTPDQLSRLVKAADGIDPVIASAVALAAPTGGRRGELVALKWSDIDLVIGRLHIVRSLTVTRGEQHTGATKTHAARERALDPVTVEVLKRRWA